ncbi:ornithine--oxo-acid transaminase [Paenibacillus sp. UNCCL117]|uniref:ornithine--oxo-acid transaminase n=1 Tax=unclassified Paenibacillus TaxID=185978 RepID=UPI00088AF53A|nr:MULTISPECIES: ornithine--oxo-acid transaminase [unclassified Paenibacillus]SDE64490.1 ornithine--oxo-acid transaminase [Paenibacillus sp. cl123]SFW70556.1 ornithine--oxo-acid transaminase [Paenibacillus sp. UNCCL117]
MTGSEDIIRETNRYGAANYEPLPIVIARGEGVWVEDAEGSRYLDMLSSYSALNHGHRHPRIMRALLEQAGKVALTSRAFHHEHLGRFYAWLHRLTGKSRFLPMNTGAEAVETAIKAARRWAYRVKGIPPDQADIIVCEGNFHGRTLAATSMSTHDAYKDGFGPFLPGFTAVPFGDAEALRRAITPHTAGFLIEPIQGESGIVIPPDGYLSEAAAICRAQRVLLIADEIQTGLGRTGRMFACDWEGVTPDMYVLGKSLGGGVLPVSAIAADDDVMQVFDPGSHGSTFGGNPLACAVAAEAMQVLEEEGLARRALEQGGYLLERLEPLRKLPWVKDIRGRGLFIGVELTGPARPYCELLMRRGLLCKETHQTTLRLAPPLIIGRQELDFAVERLLDALAAELPITKLGGEQP